MVLDEFGGMGVGGNARSRWKCQAGQCLIRVSGSLMKVGGIGMRLETVGKQLERIWKGFEKLLCVEGTAVMRESARNARLMGQMMYAIWFSY